MPHGSVRLNAPGSFTVDEATLDDDPWPLSDATQPFLTLLAHSKWPPSARARSCIDRILTPEENQANRSSR